jgi:tripartite-type tricarboxylate transporter receptor subunit TctC
MLALADSFTGFEAEHWAGVVAPATTPRAVIGRLNAELVKTVQRPEVMNKLDGLGFEVVGSSPDAFGRWIASESEKWGNVIRERRITLD